LLCTVLIVSLNSCDFETGSGNIITENRPVGSFSGIEASAGIEVEVKVGTTTTVRVEADDNVVKHIETRVSGDILKIRLESRHGFSNAHMKVFVTTPSLRSIKAESSAGVKVLDVIKEDAKIRFEASSSADIEAEVDAPEVAVEASSSASVTLSGRTKNYKVEVSSSAEIKSGDLLSENADVDASSSGSAEVYASVSLNAKASSSGSIDYRGAASVTKTENSSGSVDKKD
jgi:hypothetical protein